MVIVVVVVVVVVIHSPVHVAGLGSISEAPRLLCSALASDR